MYLSKKKRKLMLRGICFNHCIFRLFNNQYFFYQRNFWAIPSGIEWYTPIIFVCSKLSYTFFNTKTVITTLRESWKNSFGYVTLYRKCTISFIFIRILSITCFYTMWSSKLPLLLKHRYFLWSCCISVFVHFYTNFISFRFWKTTLIEHSKLLNFIFIYMILTEE